MTLNRSHMWVGASQAVVRPPFLTERLPSHIGWFYDNEYICTASYHTSRKDFGVVASANAVEK